MDKSEHINELAKALAEAQSEMGAAHKDAVNPFFKSSYADLGSIWRACKEPLNKHGLSVSQLPDITSEGKFVLSTTLMHCSGQWISGQYPINPIKNDPQSIGSSISYARRYSLASVVGIVTTDDDGEAAQNRGGKGAPLEEIAKQRAAQTPENGNKEHIHETSRHHHPHMSHQTQQRMK